MEPLDASDAAAAVVEDVMCALELALALALAWAAELAEWESDDSMVANEKP